MNNLFSSSLALYVFNILVSCVLIFFGRKRDPRSTMMWVMVVTLLPGIGIIFYMLLGHDYRNNKKFQEKILRDIVTSDFAKKQAENIEKGNHLYADQRTKKYDELLVLSLKSDNSVFTQNNKIDLYFWGKDKFQALIEDLESAEKTIDIQYFIYKYDFIGKKIMRILERKAKEGVKVRFLYDGLGGRRLRESYFTGLKEAGGEVAIFFPSVLGILNPRINYRNHRKIVVIDDHIGYIGGFNVGDEYLGMDKKVGPWRDTHIRIDGSGVAGLKTRFLKDFRFAARKNLDPSHDSDMIVDSGGSSGVQIVTSGPDTQFENIKNVFFKMINLATDVIRIQSPYFVPDESIMDALRTAIISGVKVEIMIPGNPDHPFVFWAALSYLGELLAIGAKVYFYKNGFMHNKNIMVDDYVTALGSANMDIRSFSLNFEANVIIYDENVNRQMNKQFNIDKRASERLTLEMYQHRSKLTKIKEAFSRLLSPVL